MNYICIFFITIFLSSCSPKIETISEIEGDSLEQQMITAYNTGVKALEEGDVLYATKNLMKQNYYILNLSGPHNHH